MVGPRHPHRGQEKKVFERPCRFVGSTESAMDTDMGGGTAKFLTRRCKKLRRDRCAYGEIAIERDDGPGARWNPPVDRTRPLEGVPDDLGQPGPWRALRDGWGTVEGTSGPSGDERDLHLRGPSGSKMKANGPSLSSPVGPMRRERSGPNRLEATGRHGPSRGTWGHGAATGAFGTTSNAFGPTSGTSGIYRRLISMASNDTWEDSRGGRSVAFFPTY